MKTRSIAILFSSVVSLAACDGLREALTAHVDVAARAEDRELSVNRLSDMLGNSTLQIPVSRETAMIVGDLWVNYQLLGVAAARGDSLNDPKLVDEAALGITSNARLRRYMESVAKTFKMDSASETTYNQATGGLLAARHILFPLPGGATQPQKDSVRRKAESVRAQLTPKNFADMAKKHSGDPGSAQRGGSLGAFRREEMVKPFSDAVASLRPGQISPLVETQFGYHIIQRPTYTEAKTDYDAAFGQSGTQRAESVYVAKLDDDMKITVKPNAAATAKTASRELSAHRSDGDEIASYKGGNLTVGRFVRWVESYPPQMRLAQQMAQAPDSLVRQFVKSIARNEVMLKKADSAGITMTAEEKQQLYAEFKQLVGSLWQQLGIDPKVLADSGKSAAEREKVAASRVESYLDRVMSGQAQPISVPLPVQTVLTTKFKSKVYPAGVDRAVERAKKLRAVADSTRSANQPRSQVPLPMPPSDTAAKRDTAAGGKRP
jgi:peptidyl-prolyl cis-trans isomerase D